MGSSRIHIPALDGLRGVAVLLVMMVHFTPDVVMSWRSSEFIKKAFLTGGWIGVELFFVLSGFLITSILLRSKDSPQYFRNFYMRRALRIFPLYYAALAVVFLILPAVGFLYGQSLVQLRTIEPFLWLYMTNAAWWLLGSDLFLTSQIKVAHFWSLAVEEHFYLMWPALIWVLRSSSIRKICIVLFVSAFAIRVAGYVAQAPTGFFYMTFCRWDSLAAGAFIAASFHKSTDFDLNRARPIAWFVTGAGTVIILSYFFLAKGLWAGSGFTVTFGLSAISATFGAILFLVVHRQEGSIPRLLSSVPLRFFGTYSYGLYVIHGLLWPSIEDWLPMDAWMSHFERWPLIGCFALAFARIAICVPLAMLSWHLFEKPILNLKRYFGGEATYPSNSSLALNPSQR
jgi:peptidoglycan/LPS O-acetylase OafA/YrhL